MLNRISNFAVMADKTLDFIPFISTVTNLTDLIAKAIFSKMSKSYYSDYKKIKNSPFVKHINNKKIAKCVFLAIPFLNVYLACKLTSYVRKDSLSVSQEDDFSDDDTEEIKRTPTETDKQVNKKVELILRKTKLCDDFLQDLPTIWFSEQNRNMYEDKRDEFREAFQDALQINDLDQMETLLNELEGTLSALRDDCKSKGFI